MINSAQFNEIFENEKFCRGCDADERHIPSSNSIKQIEQMSRIESLERWSHVIPVSPSLCLSLARSLSHSDHSSLLSSDHSLWWSDSPLPGTESRAALLRSWGTAARSSAVSPRWIWFFKQKQGARWVEYMRKWAGRSYLLYPVTTCHLSWESRLFASLNMRNERSRYDLIFGNELEFPFLHINGRAWLNRHILKCFEHN